MSECVQNLACLRGLTIVVGIVVTEDVWVVDVYLNSMTRIRYDNCDDLREL